MAEVLNNPGFQMKEFNCLRPDNTGVKSILLSGVLEKQSNSGLFYNKRLLFIVSPGVLKYRNEESQDPKLDETNHTMVKWKK